LDQGAWPVGGAREQAHLEKIEIMHTHTCTHAHIHRHRKPRTRTRTHTRTHTHTHAHLPRPPLLRARHAARRAASGRSSSAAGLAPGAPPPSSSIRLVPPCTPPPPGPLPALALAPAQAPAPARAHALAGAAKGPERARLGAPPPSRPSSPSWCSWGWGWGCCWYCCCCCCCCWCCWCWWPAGVPPGSRLWQKPTGSSGPAKSRQGWGAVNGERVCACVCVSVLELPKWGQLKHRLNVEEGKEGRARSTQNRASHFSAAPPNHFTLACISSAVQPPNTSPWPALPCCPTHNHLTMACTSQLSHPQPPHRVLQQPGLLAQHAVALGLPLARQRLQGPHRLGTCGSRGGTSCSNW